MKTVNVMVMLQIDIDEERNDDVKEVQDAMEIINDAIAEKHLESCPQIFIENICEADIRDAEEDWDEE